MIKSLKLAAEQLSISVDSIIEILSENFDNDEIKSMNLPDILYQVNYLADFEDNYDRDSYHDVYHNDGNY